MSKEHTPSPTWRDIWHVHRSALRCFDPRTWIAVLVAGGLAGLMPILASAVMAAVSQGMTVTTALVPLSLLAISCVAIGLCLGCALRWAFRAASVFDGDRHAAAWRGVRGDTAWFKNEVVSRIFGHEFARLGWAGEGLRLLYGACLTIIAISTLAWIDRVLGAAALLAAVICVALCLVMACRRVAVLDQVRIVRSRLTTCLIEYLSVFLRLETTGARDPALAGLRDLMSGEASARARAVLLSAVTHAIPLVAAAALVFVAYGIEMPMEGQSDSAMFVLLVLGIANLTIGLLCITRGMNGMTMDARRLMSYAVGRSRQGQEASAQTRATALSGRISLSGVCYRPSGLARPVLQSIDLAIEPGSCVAIVGPSGSGKTTLIKLIAGLLRADEGVVRYDGVAIDEVCGQALPWQIGAVLDDHLPDETSIYENVAAFSGATGEQVAAAAEFSGLAGEVARFPQGMGTQVGPWGSLLSAGQRQRMMLARALVTEPDIVLVDDALHAIDANDVSDVLHRIRETGRTLVVSSQRPAVLRNADQVVVLEDGRITSRI